MKAIATFAAGRFARLTGLLLAGLLGAGAARAQTQTPTTITPVSLTTAGTAATQDFNTLISTTSGTSSTLPSGWGFVETPTDNLYSVTIASVTDAGGAYSLGSTSAADRAFGTFYGSPTLPAVGVVAMVGGAFTNNTGQTITGLVVSYTGEQWRLGSSTRTTYDRLDFQYSLSATSLASGTYTDLDALDFSTPVIQETGASKNGNSSAYRTALSATIPVTLTAGATIYLRWVDIDAASGSDDALGVDDFSITPIVVPTLTTSTPSVSSTLGTTVTVGGNVSSAGTPASVTETGVVYSTTNTNPTIGGTGVTKLAIGSGTGTFSTALSGLSPYTTYYVAAYATNTGTGYGSVLSFTTGAGQISLTALGTAYTQNFDALGINASPSSTTYGKNTLPAGWDFAETGTGADNTYSGNLSSTGNTYSLGTNSSTDRAFGTVQNIVASTIGAAYVNNTGSTITGLLISYTGEQWRNGNSARTQQDRLDFQYSTTATSLSSGTYTDYNALDFAGPRYATVTSGGVTVDYDGNLTANRTPLTATIPVSILPGGSFYIRWTDLDVTGGADDALGIDDFSLTPVTMPTVTTATPTAITSNSYGVGGNVTDAGTSAVTARGVVYSTTNTDPTVGGTGVTQLAIGSGTGTFNSTLSSLLAYTTYYVKAYATNSAGTSYGAMSSFTTGASQISITTLGTAYTENFNTLASTGTTNAKSTLPQGWDFVETDLTATTVADNTYSTATPSTGNTFSLGSSGSSDRALGMVQNATLISTIGAAYVNNTGSTITSLLISYTGEQWRLGNDSRTALDRMDFQYSTTATSLGSGTYVDADELDFSSRVVGSASGTGVGQALDGNLAANRSNFTATLAVSIAPGATFFLRWSDYNAPGGADDALGVDDFSLTALSTTPDLTVSDERSVAGAFNNVTVTSSGTATLGGTLAVGGTMAVQSSAVLNTNCQTISGAGSFSLAAGATLQVCDPAGISASGSTGAVQVSGSRSFSTDAIYLYNGTAAQSTGSGLPATVRTLELNNAAGLSLSQTVAPTLALTLTKGVLSTGANQVTLGSTASISESSSGYVTGTVQATRDLSVSGATETFGGLGLSLTPSTTGGASLPGLTTVRRVTGTPLNGEGSSVSVKRYFDISAQVNSGLNVTMVFRYLSHELNGLTATALSLFRSVSGTSGPWSAQRAGAVRDVAGLSVTLPGVTGFSIWTLGDDNNALPVELAEFTAQAAGSANELRWRTASEKSNEYFAIERSFDGQEFTQIGQVQGQGSKSSSTDYSYSDDKLTTSPLHQLTYYRLRQVDLDGTASYSPVRTVRRGAGELSRPSLRVYPTVLVDGLLRYDYQGPALGAEATLELYSLTGTLLARLPQPAALGRWQLPRLPAGTYVLRLRAATGSSQTRFVLSN